MSSLDDIPLVSASRGEAASPRVRQVVRLLCQDPQLRAARLASVVGLTAHYLEQLFKKEIGMSIGGYSMELRLVRARHLLVTTFKSVKEIRNEAGSSDAGNFSHWFKRRFGMTPSAYRAQANRRLDRQIAVHTNETPLRPIRPVLSTPTEVFRNK